MLGRVLRGDGDDRQERRRLLARDAQSARLLRQFCLAMPTRFCTQTAGEVDIRPALERDASELVPPVAVSCSPCRSWSTPLISLLERAATVSAMTMLGVRSARVLRRAPRAPVPIPRPAAGSMLRPQQHDDDRHDRREDRRLTKNWLIAGPHPGRRFLPVPGEERWRAGRRALAACRRRRGTVRRGRWRAIPSAQVRRSTLVCVGSPYARHAATPFTMTSSEPVSLSLIAREASG